MNLLVVSLVIWIALKNISRDKSAAENEEICVAARGCEFTTLTLLISNESILFLYMKPTNLAVSDQDHFSMADFSLVSALYKAIPDPL